MDYKNKYDKYMSKVFALKNLIILSGQHDIQNNIQNGGNNFSSSSDTDSSMITEDLIDTDNVDYTKNLLNKSFYNKAVQKSGEFAQIGFKYKTDKVTHHNYYSFYPQYIEIYKKLSDKAMLEIGVDKSRSLKLWLDYFPRAYIYIKCCDKKKYASKLNRQIKQ